jgi:hypothetical protein
MRNRSSFCQTEGPRQFPSSVISVWRNSGHAVGRLATPLESALGNCLQGQELAAKPPRNPPGPRLDSVPSPDRPAQNELPCVEINLPLCAGAGLRLERTHCGTGRSWTRRVSVGTDAGGSLHRRTTLSQTADTTTRRGRDGRSDRAADARQPLGQPAIQTSGTVGATPKDGPSAGVTLAAALASLLVKRTVRADTAMTGEITLSGLVLPVGGIKEKVLAAYRGRIRRVILPTQNEKDLDKLPGHVKQKLEFVFVGKIDDALSAAIPDLPVAGRPVPREPVEKRERVARPGIFPAVDE